MAARVCLVFRPGFGVWLLPSALLLLMAASASANGLRCSNKLVEPGRTSYEVRALCGPPDDAQQRTEQRKLRRYVQQPCATGLCTLVVEDTVDVVVEDWTYDFGPQRFLQFLRFEAGKLVRVTSGPYGSKPL